jgi:methyl-accepting chemotaxis protein
MARSRTFEQKLIAAFVVVMILTIAIASVSVLALHQVVSSKDDVINADAATLISAERLRTARTEKGSAARGFFLTADQKYLDDMTAARTTFLSILDELEGTASTTTSRQMLETIRAAESAHQDVLDGVVSLRRTDASPDEVSRAFDQDVTPVRGVLDAAISSFVTKQGQHLSAARQDSTDTASRASALVLIMAATTVVGALLVGYLLTRTLRRTIGATVSDVQSSSAELQATANQQATGAREQATAMSEITTTISELLATARQIADGAQRVAQIAERTAAAGREGEDTIAKAQESISGIRHQMDLIVNHMLALGEKSQQIGAVLDIVSELAEQTNILAINATIEAAGAGDAGLRFAIVADEIRKLADRVADSTKEIRGMIDDVRGAVNTTVMATEIGSKAVDSGSTQFTAVATSFGEIAELVTTTTDAAREIELSTKQQTIGVDQVNVAALDVAQATRETEASASQTLQTASQLSALSSELKRLVKTGATESR